MKKSEFAIASLVLGVISFIQLLGAERALAAIIFGAIALWKIKKEPELEGRWMAFAGIGLGMLYLIVLGVNLPQIVQLLEKMVR